MLSKGEAAVTRNNNNYLIDVFKINKPFIKVNKNIN